MKKSVGACLSLFLCLAIEAWAMDQPYFSPEHAAETVLLLFVLIATAFGLLICVGHLAKILEVGPFAK